MARLDEPVPQRSVTRAESFYLPPPSRPADAWRLVPPAERVVRWYEEQAQRQLPRPTGTIVGVRLYAQINHGRWVADCPECGSAQIVTPADPRMYCVECLSGWFQIVFPADTAAAERSVEQQPVREQNWWHPDDDAAWNRPREPEPSEPEPVRSPEPADPDREGGR
jgi:hypothetical protein